MRRAGRRALRPHRRRARGPGRARRAPHRSNRPSTESDRASTPTITRPRDSGFPGARTRWIPPAARTSGNSTAPLPRASRDPVVTAVPTGPAASNQTASPVTRPRASIASPAPSRRCSASMSRALAALRPIARTIPPTRRANARQSAAMPLPNATNGLGTPGRPERWRTTRPVRRRVPARERRPRRVAGGGPGSWLLQTPGNPNSGLDRYRGGAAARPAGRGYLFAMGETARGSPRTRRTVRRWPSARAGSCAASPAGSGASPPAATGPSAGGGDAAAVRAATTAGRQSANPAGPSQSRLQGRRRLPLPEESERV